jgi:putative SOS response-associated peptidase YedK
LPFLQPGGKPGFLLAPIIPRRPKRPTPSLRPYNDGMCGRFTLRVPSHKLIEQFGLEMARPDEPWDAIVPRYNIAPSQTILAVRPSANGRELVSMKWGFVPAWATHAKGAMINARSESAASKPTFRDAFRKRRCLIPADGFYEWKKSGRRKEPYHIRLTDGQLFAFVGLWETWHGQDTCTILTTTANQLVASLHDRMPVILDPEDYSRWLDSSTQAEELQTLLKPYSEEKLKTTAVDLRVNSAAIDDAQCLAPPRSEGTLF